MENIGYSALDLARQAELHEKEKISFYKSKKCIECINCRSWNIKTKHGSIKAGYCLMHDMPLFENDLRTSIYDMCEFVDQARPCY